MLRRLWARWKPIAQRIGDFQGRILLTLFYFLIVTPFGLGMRFFSDRLRQRPSAAPSYWLARETHETDLEEAQGQS